MDGLVMFRVFFFLVVVRNMLSKSMVVLVRRISLNSLDVGIAVIVFFVFVDRLVF